MGAAWLKASLKRLSLYQQKSICPTLFLIKSFRPTQFPMMSSLSKYLITRWNNSLVHAGFWFNCFHHVIKIFFSKLHSTLITGIWKTEGEKHTFLIWQIHVKKTKFNKSLQHNTVRLTLYKHRLSEITEKRKSFLGDYNHQQIILKIPL